MSELFEAREFRVPAGRWYLTAATTDEADQAQQFLSQEQAQDIAKLLNQPIPMCAAATTGDPGAVDEALDPYLPESIRGEKRCGIQRSAWITTWFVPWSPRNDNENAEGPWSHWVALAHEIIKADAEARIALQKGLSQ